MDDAAAQAGGLLVKPMGRQMDENQARKRSERAGERG